ncbi:hypothetical protein O988_01685 [Pseudogymnoascus sp. VKM F-3808]|nr:hypothetical protein O988_01685 [Pseudogymnoascus sp. VKM F-3808]
MTRNPTILDDLFYVYFAWIHPVCTLFSERHFAQPYKTQNHQHCSALLVNAMCALACHLHTPSEDNDEEYDQLGTRFAEAFRSDFDTADESITTIQATAVMFLLDLAGGFGMRASSYLRLASEKIAEFSSTAVGELSYSLKNTIQVNGHNPPRLGPIWQIYYLESRMPLLIRDVESSRSVDMITPLCSSCTLSSVTKVFPLCSSNKLSGPTHSMHYPFWRDITAHTILVAVLQMLAISSICDFIFRFFPTKSTNDASIEDGPEAIALGLQVLQESFIVVPAAGAIREMLSRQHRCGLDYGYDLIDHVAGVLVVVDAVLLSLVLFFKSFRSDLRVRPSKSTQTARSRPQFLFDRELHLAKCNLWIHVRP